MVYTCVLSALARLNPTRAVAPSGMVTGAIALGFRRGRGGGPSVQYELASTGLGGTSTGDGAPLVSPMNHFTPGLPVEILETEYPVRVRRYDMWRDSAGAGRHRGGVGYVRELELLEDCVPDVALVRPPLPVLGRGRRRCAGDVAHDARCSRDGKRGARSGRSTPAISPPATILRIERSGGGGYGPPAERSAEAVRDDVANGYIGMAAARDVYGVVIDPTTHAVDCTATQALRRELGRERE